jgi:serine phosphatase RsbU (regulator of sigma subunit)
VRRDRQTIWDLEACIGKLSALAGTEENVMDALLAHVRELSGSAHLDDDFSLIEARFE